jgi:hypothetical protein
MITLFIYSHPLDPPEDKQNESNLLLGHVSMVTDMVINIWHFY